MDLIVNMNYHTTRSSQDEKCLSCESQLSETAWFVMDQSNNIYEIYCNEQCQQKNYKTVGKSLLVDYLKNSNFKLIPDNDEYVIKCQNHGLISTGTNIAEVIQDLENHKKECE